MRPGAGRPILAAVGWVLLGAANVPAADPPPGATVTFNRDVAPIVFANCSGCHRPGASGPFPLLSHGDARKRHKQIAKVTRTGYMPPWLPARGHGEFAGDRRLTAAQIRTFQEWSSQGAVEGDPDDLPPAPRFTEGWTLGRPDLVLEMPQPYSLAADGADVYRNFVIPSSVREERHVEAVEFHPGNPRVAHHARILVDRTPASRLLDAQNPVPGFDGMEGGGAETPDGILLGWTPGKVPHAGTPGIAWRLGPETDVVFQIHMVPSGKRESIQAKLGLYFAERPPTRHPLGLVLGSREIDIPAGEDDYRVEDSYTLPVDVELMGIYPHAHYLGKRMAAWVVQPDGTRRSLLLIEDWDFNWQDEYRYNVPVPLGAGTRLVMSYSYDNSVSNVRNPSYPPRRVTYGPGTSDEMAELMLQVLPRSEHDLAGLREDFDRHRVDEAIEYRQRRIASAPDDASNYAALGSIYLYLERPAEAIPFLRKALRIEPDAQVHNNLGYALRAGGDLDGAVEQYREALRLRPDMAETLRNLALALRDAGQLDGAVEAYRDVVRLQPESVRDRVTLASLLRSLGRVAEALPHCQVAARLAPDSPAALNDLAWILVTHPDLGSRDVAQAIRLAETAARLTGHRDAIVLATLAATYAASGSFDRAIRTAEQAVALAPESAREELRRHLALYRRGEPYRR